MTAIFAWPRLLDPDMAREYVGGQIIFDDLVERKLIVPRVQIKRCTRYDRVELDDALDKWEGFVSK